MVQNILRKTTPSTQESRPLSVIFQRLGREVFLHLDKKNQKKITGSQYDIRIKV